MERSGRGPLAWLLGRRGVPVILVTVPPGGLLHVLGGTPQGSPQGRSGGGYRYGTWKWSGKGATDSMVMAVGTVWLWLVMEGRLLSLGPRLDAPSLAVSSAACKLHGCLLGLPRVDSGW